MAVMLGRSYLGGLGAAGITDYSAPHRLILLQLDAVVCKGNSACIRAPPMSTTGEVSGDRGVALVSLSALTLLHPEPCPLPW